jgi:hypothetical protein
MHSVAVKNPQYRNEISISSWFSYVTQVLSQQLQIQVQNELPLPPYQKLCRQFLLLE